MLTQKAPALAMRGQLVEDFAGARATIGGSSESEVNAWHVKPTGAPSSMAVTTVTPVAKWPNTSRNRAWSKSTAPVARRSPASEAASWIVTRSSTGGARRPQVRPRSMLMPSLATDTSSSRRLSCSRRAWLSNRSISRSVRDGS